MIYVEKGKERDSFIAFIEHALGILSKKEYTSFLSLFDNSRLSEQDLIRALQYLDETRQVEFKKKGAGYIVLFDDLHTM